MQLLSPSTWGPTYRGVQVEINPSTLPILGPKIALDIETDEKDGFVGGAVYDSSSIIYYFTNPIQFKDQVRGKQLIGYNIKADLNWLGQMGLTIPSTSITSDPMIQAYVVNSNRDDQGLKAVAMEVLGWKWPSYRDMVGIGRKKITLDKQEIEKVAEYCCMDTLAAWKLDEYFTKTFNKQQRDLYTNIELPCYRLLWDMECNGIKLNTTTLSQINTDFSKEVILAEAQLRAYNFTWNPNSPPQTLVMLNKLIPHYFFTETNKPTLLAYKIASTNPHPVIDQLLAYKKIKKLHSTYVVAMTERTQTTDIIHTTFNQVAIQDDGSLKGIRTGRLSSNNPNLQNIPSSKKGETYGNRLRSMFVPRQGKVFIDIDYSQIEYRLLAHFSQDTNLVKGFNTGLDVHDVTGKLLGCSRSVGKTLNFASIYGAGEDKISLTAGIPVAQAAGFLKAYWQKLPQVLQWKNTSLMLAKARGGISTMSGRFIPIPDLKSKNRWKVMHAERAAINYIIQGSAADIIKVAMLEVNKQGYKPVLQVHDELIFEVDPTTAQEDMKKLVSIMENVVKLSVPIIADAHIGSNWNDAKEGV